MKETIVRSLHPVAGGLGFVIIATFWGATLLSEVFGSEATIEWVKTTIPWGFCVLIPATIGAGASGTALSAGDRRGVLGAKSRRMPFIAANGLFILIPAALFLASKAQAREFDTTFYVVQAIELSVGLTNMLLLAASIRDGLRATQWRRGSSTRQATKTKIKFMRKESVAVGTSAFFFERPQQLEFRAGQAGYFTIPNITDNDNGGRRRVFSIASAPGEADLMVVTRASKSAFKTALWKLKPGETIDFEGPYGTMVPSDNAPSRRLVLIAGGMGITPFRSIITNAVRAASPRAIVLFYSIHTLNSAPFLQELKAQTEANPRVTMIPTVTSGGAGWTGERGIVTAAMLQRHLGSLKGNDFYIAGPPQMVRDMRGLLGDCGVSVACIKSEGFAGYHRPSS